MELLPIFFVIVAALIFTYTNGFHDTANAIATCVSTRALSVKAAIIMAAGGTNDNFTGVEPTSPSRQSQQEHLRQSSCQYLSMAFRR